MSATPIWAPRGVPLGQSLREQSRPVHPRSHEQLRASSQRPWPEQACEYSLDPGTSGSCSLLAAACCRCLLPLLAAASR